MRADTLWERIKQGILDGASTAAETAGHLGRLGKARLEVASARHAIREALAELGGEVYAALAEDEAADLSGSAEVRERVAEIRALEAQLQVVEARLASLGSDEDPEAPPSSPAPQGPAAAPQP